MKTWAEISGGTDYQDADPDVRSEVQQKFLDQTFKENPSLGVADKMKIMMGVKKEPEPVPNAPGKKEPSVIENTGQVHGFLGRAAIKAGRTAGTLLDLPFVPLHKAKDVAVEQMEKIPALGEKLYSKTLDKEGARKFLTDKGVPYSQVENMIETEQNIPERFYSYKREGPTVARAIGEVGEIALTGPYIRGVIGALGKVFVPASQYVQRATQDAGVLLKDSDSKILNAASKLFPEKWTSGKMSMERAGYFFHNYFGGAPAAGVGVKGKWERLVPDAAKRDQVRDLIEDNIAVLAKEAQTDPVKLQEFNQKMSGLDQGQKEALGWYVGRDEARRNLAMQEGIIRQFQDNYVPHIVEEIQTNKTGVLFQLHRSIKMSLKELESLGKNPFMGDISTADAIHEVAFQRLLAKKRFSNAMKVIKADDGNPAVIGETEYEKALASDPAIEDTYKIADPKYTRLSSLMGYYKIRKAQAIGQGAEQVEGVLTQVSTNAYVHKDFYRQVRQFLPPFPGDTATGEAIKQMIGGARRFIMFNPAFHGINVGSEVVSAAPFGNAAKVAQFYKEGGKIETGWRNGEDLATSVITEATHDGLRAPGISNEWYKSAKDFMSKAAPDKPGLYGRITEASDKLLFDTMVTHPQIGLYKHVKDKWTPLIGEQEAGKVAATFANTVVGTLPIESFSPFAQRYGNWLLFSRSWTSSNFRSLFQAAGVPWGARHLTEAGMKALAAEQQGVVFNSMAYLGIYNEIMNHVIAGHSSAENPPGHEMDVDTGRVDKRGRRIYVAGSPFLFVRQMARMAGHLGEGDVNALVGDLYGKLGVWKGAAEAALNKDVFANKSVVEPGAPMSEQIGKRLMHSAAALTPFGTTMRDAMQPGNNLLDTIRTEASDPLTYTRLLTYWQSHGLNYSTDTFSRLKRADRWMVLQNMSDEARTGLIRGMAFGRIDGTAAIELKKLKDKLTYMRDTAREEARMAIINGKTEDAAKILAKAGWSTKGARVFISTRGRQTGALMGEKEEE